MDECSGSLSNVCGFCKENSGIYTCPRCNVNYCSVPCYRSPNHSNCSETFYKECVEEDLRLREPDPEERNKIIEILKRNFEDNDCINDSDDSDDDIPLEDRLSGIDLDDTEEVWSKLTFEEQKEFLELAKVGDISKYVPIWEPWWMETHKKSKVTFMDSSPSKMFDYKASCPKVVSDIPSLQGISKSNPSPLLFNNLLNVISAYSMVARFLNGEHDQMSDEAASLLLDLSKNLSKNINFDTLDLALESVSVESTNNQIILATQENTCQMRNDVIKIFMGPNEDEPTFYLLAALSECASLFREATKSPKHSSLTTKKKMLPAIFSKKLEINYTKKQYKSSERKIHYYLSWVQASYSSIYNLFKQSFPP